MKISYDPKADALYIQFQEGKLAGRICFASGGTIRLFLFLSEPPRQRRALWVISNCHP